MAIREKFRTGIQRALSLFKGSHTRAKTARGGVWLGIGSGIENALRIVRNMILARILAPDDFGLMSIIFAICQLMESFTQIGIQESVVQDPQGDKDEFLNAVFFINAARGFVLFLVSLASVPLFVRYFNKPQLAAPLAITASVLLLNSLRSVKIYSELKAMNYRVWALVNHGGVIAGILFSIVCGMVYHSVWALVYGYILESIGRLILSYGLAPYYPQWKFVKQYTQSFLAFAKGMLGLPLIFYLYNKIDIFVIGKLCSQESLGRYTLIQGLASSIFTLYDTTGSKLLLPLFSSLNKDTVLLRQKYLVTTKTIVSLTLPILTAIGCCHKPIIALMYGSQYAPSSYLFALFCCVTAIQIIGTVPTSVIFALGKPSQYRSASLIRMICICLVIIPLVMTHGIAGSASAFIISMVVWLVSVIHIANSTLTISFLSYGKLYIQGLWISVIIVACSMLLIHLW